MSGDDNDDHVNDCSDDIYIMMKCLSVCASRKIITSHFRAERRRREVSSLLGLAGWLWRSDDYELVVVVMVMMMLVAVDK